MIRFLQACFTLLVAVLGIGIGMAILSLPAESTGLRDPFLARLEASGVKHPVTAVLLNFRAYDTLLEVGVLLLAALGVRALGVRALGSELGPPGAERSRGPRFLLEAPGPVLAALVRTISPWIIVVSGYLLWEGSHAPGGAFQSGALLSAMGVLILLSDPRWAPRVPDWFQKVLLCAGPLVFIGVGLASLVSGLSFLQYPVAASYWLILLIEVTCAVSIAAVLVLLFAGGEPAPVRDAGRERPRETR